MNFAESKGTATKGRTSSRRMNRYEYENTLRTLLQLPDLHVREFLPRGWRGVWLQQSGGSLDVLRMSKWLGIFRGRTMHCDLLWHRLPIVQMLRLSATMYLGPTKPLRR